jgi:hypothetical protein
VELFESACDNGNPYLAFAKYYLAPESSYLTVGALNDSPRDTFDYPNNPRAISLATFEQVGTVYGLAYDWQRQHLYMASFLRLGSPYGPAGAGAVYRLDLESDVIEHVLSLEAGHDADRFDDDVFDMKSLPWVMKKSLGDIDVDVNANVLSVVNALDRKVYTYSLSDLSLVSSFDHGASAEAWAHDARPFGLGYRDGWLFHGVVNSRQEGTATGEFVAKVYRSRPNGDKLEQVASLDLSYPRQPPWTGWYDGIRGMPDRETSHPIVIDLDSSSDGTLIVGLQDRFYHTGMHYQGLGDILNGRPSPDGHWHVVTEPEHYDDNLGRDPSGSENHEFDIGALASIPWLNTVVTGAVRPPAHGGGEALKWYDISTGRVAGPNEGYEWATGDGPGIGDIEVLCRPGDVETPTPSIVTTATATPTATALPSPSPSVTAEASPVFLPLAARSACLKLPVPLDVALVLDQSTSMLRHTRSGRTKSAAILDAALSFLALVPLDAIGEETARARAAVVGFNDTAWLEQRLTSDRVALLVAIERLPERTAEGTRLDLALARGAEALLSDSSGRARSRVIILLTDGMPNLVPTPAPGGTQDETVLVAARRARQRGVVIYTIGVGAPDAGNMADRINPDLLRAVASEPSMYYEAPDGDDVDTIYAEIAADIVCP